MSGWKIQALSLLIGGGVALVAGVLVLVWRQWGRR